MKQPLSTEVIPSPSGRARKHESTLTLFTPEPGLIPIGEYQRLSLAKTDAQAQLMAMARQDTRDAVEAEGACVTRSYADPDHSGSKRSIVRPAFVRMIADLDAGLIQGIACSDIDRVTRLHGILERLIERYEDNPHYFWHSNDPRVDLRTEEGRDEARARVDAGNKEAKSIARRQQARHDQYRKLGYMVGSRGYGYTTRGEPVPAEVEVIQMLAEAVKADRQLQPLLDKLADAGIVGRSGKPFSHRTVKAILTSARIAGLRVDMSAEDGIARDNNENPIKGNQPEIISYADWQIIQARYAAIARGAVMRKYLGSGTFICECGHVMNGGWIKDLNRHRYICAPGRPGHCGQNVIHGPKADEILRALVESALAQEAPEMAEPEPWPDADKLARVQERRADAKARRDAGDLDAETWLDQDMAAAEVEGTLRKAQREWAKAHPLTTVPANQALLDRWHSGEQDQQRSVVGHVLRGVLVAPSAPGLTLRDRLTPLPRDL